MIQEDKDLLFKDLCARLPYGTKCIVTKSRTEEGQKGDIGRIARVCLEGVDCIDNTVFFSEFGNFKPYLFPLSSMTEEQRQELESLMEVTTVPAWGEILSPTTEYYDWLNKNHFDYRGLIKMGIAIDATGLNIY